MIPDIIKSYSALVILIILWNIYVVYKNKKEGTTLPICHIIGTFIFAFLITGMFYVAGLPDIFNFELSIEKINMDILTNWPSAMGLYIANVIMFMPLGFMLPLLWREYHNPLRVLFFSFGLSMVIEISQLFNHRVTDIDDLITNTLGGLLGYVIYFLFYLIVKPLFKHFKVDWFSDPPGFWLEYENKILIILVYLGNFFLSPLAFRLFFKH